MRTAHAFKYRNTGYEYPSGTIGELVGRGWAGEFPSITFSDISARATLERPAGFSREGVGPMGKTGGVMCPRQDGYRGEYPLVWDRGKIYAGRMGQTVASALKDFRRSLAARHQRAASMAVATAAGRLKGWGKRQRDTEEEVVLESAPIPSGYGVVTGVEVEYYPRMGGTGFVTKAIFRAGLAGSVSVTSDGSLSWGGVELRVMATREHLERVVRKALAIAPGWVDSSCGLHVHLDMRHRDVDLVWANLLAMEGVICRSQPKERIMPEGGGGYCKMLKASEKVLSSPATRGRYRAINAASLGKGTIEVRAHTGSSNPNKILAWCEFLNAIAGLGTKILPGATAEETLANFESLAWRKFPYVRERMVRFSQGWAGALTSRASEPEDGEDSEVEAEHEDPEGDTGGPETYPEPLDGCDCRACALARGRGADV